MPKSIFVLCLLAAGSSLAFASPTEIADLPKWQEGHYISKGVLPCAGANGVVELTIILSLGRKASGMPFGAQMSLSKNGVWIGNQFAQPISENGIYLMPLSLPALHRHAPRFGVLTLEFSYLGSVGRGNAHSDQVA